MQTQPHLVSSFYTAVSLCLLKTYWFIVRRYTTAALINIFY